jgi:hypothetical protein
MAGNQINFSATDIARIQSKIGANGAGKYSAAYREVLVINSERRNAGQPTLDSKTEFWFKNAAEVNENNARSSSNVFIREVTVGGLTIDGKSAGNMQSTSNNIGNGVIQQLDNAKGVPDIGLLIQQDISSALQLGQQTIGGWGGSFYYWNEPYTNPQTGQTTTVGQAIKNDPVEYEKFLAVNAKALSDTIGFQMNKDYGMGAGSAGLFATEIGSNFTAGYGADAPPSVKADIIARAVYGKSTGSYAGDPNTVNGYSKMPDGTWQLDVRDLGGGFVPADPATSAQLNAISNARASLQGKCSLGSLGGDPQNEAIGIDADGLQYRNAAGETESVQIKTSVFSANDIQVLVKKSGRLVASELDTKNANGTLTKQTDNNGDGTFDKTSQYRADGTIEIISGSDTLGNTFKELFNGAGILASYAFRKPDGAEMSLTGDEFGKQFGSVLGNAVLSGQSAFTKITGTLLVSSLSETIGGVLSADGNLDGSLVARFANGKTTFDKALGETLNDLSENLTVNLLPDAVSGLSSLMLVELADALHLNGFAKTAFTSVTGAYTTQLVNNVISLTLAPTQAGSFFGIQSVDSIFSGFDQISIFDIVQTAAYSYFGSYLATTVYTPDTRYGLVGAQIGSAVGSFFGSLIAGPAGAGIGSFFGNIIGGTFGDFVAPPAKAGSNIVVGADGHLVSSAWHKRGGQQGLYEAAANGATSEVNAILDLMHGHAVTLGSRGQVDFYYYGTNRGTSLDKLLGKTDPLEAVVALNSSSGQHVFYDYGKGVINDPSRVFDTGKRQWTRAVFIPLDLRGNNPNQIFRTVPIGPVIAAGASSDTVPHLSTDVLKIIYDSSQTTFDYKKAAMVFAEDAAMQALKNMTVTGMDSVMSAAFKWALAHDTTVLEIYNDLNAAKSYENYLQNTASINRIIMDQPKTVFAAGWAATIARVEEMGLNTLELATIKNDDGTSAEIKYDKNNVGAWAYTQKQFGITGNLQSETITLDTGKVVNFDAMEYMASNVDVANYFHGDGNWSEVHYLNYGISEKRNPNSFDAMEYMASNVDVANWAHGDVKTAVWHYVVSGINEGRLTTSFDAAYYLSANVDIKAAFGYDLNAAKRHYVINGINEHRNYRINTVEGSNGIARTYSADRLISTRYQDFGNLNWTKDYTDYYNAAGQVAQQIGVDDRDLNFVTEFTNGAMVRWTWTDTHNAYAWSTGVYEDLQVSTGKWGRETYSYDDGTKTVQYRDLNNQNWTKDYVDTYDANGHLASETGTSDDGSTWTALNNVNGAWSKWTSTDTLSIYNWSAIVHEDFQVSSSKWGKITYNYDDGTKAIAYDDLNNANWTKTYTDYYNISGQLLRQVGVDDNGTNFSSDYTNGILTKWVSVDTTNVYAWNTGTYEAYQVSSGKWGKETWVNDDSTKAIVYRDLNNLNWTKEYTDYFEASGHMTHQVGTADNGDTWTKIFDTSANLVSYVVNHPNGFGEESLWGAQATQYGLSTYTNYRNAAGNLTTQTGTYLNGDSFNRGFDGGHSDSTLVQTYDYEYHTNGSREETSYDPDNQNVWLNYTNYRNTSGLLIKQTLKFDNGDSYTRGFDGSRADNALVMIYDFEYHTNGSREETYTAAYGMPAGLTTYMNYRNASGLLTMQTGTRTNGDTYNHGYDGAKADNALVQTYRIEFHPNGTRDETYLDTTNTNWWSQNTISYDSNSVITKQTGTADDTHIWINRYLNGALDTTSWLDPSNKFAWSSIEYSGFNAAYGLWASIETYNDDGTKTIVRNDVNNLDLTKTYTDYYNALGKITKEVGVADNGDTWTKMFDASANLTSHIINHVNNTRDETYTAAFGGLPAGVSNYTNSYNAGGFLTTQTGTRTNGDTYKKVYDGTHADNALFLKNSYDYYSNGTRGETTYDYLNQANWAKHTDYRNAAGFITSLVHSYDNGDSYNRGFDGTHGDTALVMTYDKSYHTNGTREETYFDYLNQGTWAKNTTYRNASGFITDMNAVTGQWGHVTTIYDNGTVVLT